jgi:cytochrome c peroxidase
MTVGGLAIYNGTGPSSSTYNEKDNRLRLLLPVTYAQEAAPALSKKPVDLDKVRASIVELIETDEEKRDDGTSLRGTFIRLAWHCCGSYSKEDGKGGSNGAKMRFDPEASWGNNAGLNVARTALEPIKAKFPDISYADLYTFAGVVAVEEAGGPTIPFRLGRTDEASGETSPLQDRLPNADTGSRKSNSKHIRDVFYRMGFSDKEIVALLGAHSMGRCHTDRSGFWGPWTFAENSFSNEYFRLLLEERWSPKGTHNGQPWTGPDQFEDSTGKLMMLPIDMALVLDPDFKKWVVAYAKNEELFFKEFASAFSKLLELGVPFPASSTVTAAPKPWYQFW